ncbi:MAG: 3-phosphoshikimate 1-carboxyvinyltransferase, partial [Bacteroidota bacterium]
EKNENYPPLRITGMSNQLTREIKIPGNISSQYISALLMIGPVLPSGIEIELTSEIYSRPYIEMTLGLMEHLGIRHEWVGQTINIESQAYQGGKYTIESDWSGASYWYSIAALSGVSGITLKGLRENSLQGDQEIARIMEHIGVRSTYSSDGVTLEPGSVDTEVELNFKECPDLAQTVMAVASVKGVKLKMTGLESLKIKETDRILAMQEQLAKIGGQLIEEGNQWTLIPGGNKWEDNISFDTYEDHRMAMALAPLGIIRPVVIEEPEVVVKSYPDYWKHLASVGFSLR